jgi:hypothetical protein
MERVTMNGFVNVIGVLIVVSMVTWMLGHVRPADTATPVQETAPPKKAETQADRDIWAAARYQAYLRYCPVTLSPGSVTTVHFHIAAIRQTHGADAFDLEVRRAVEEMWDIRSTWCGLTESFLKSHIRRD